VRDGARRWAGGLAEECRGRLTRLVGTEQCAHLRQPHLPRGRLPCSRLPVGDGGIWAGVGHVRLPPLRPLPRAVHEEACCRAVLSASYLAHSSTGAVSLANLQQRQGHATRPFIERGPTTHPPFNTRVWGRFACRDICLATQGAADQSTPAHVVAIRHRALTC
jgi:hypothetical protein